MKSKVASVVFTITLCINSLGLNAQTWTQKTPSFTPPRYEAAAFTIGDIGYMGTGSDNGTELQDFWAYDQTTNTWTQKTDFANGTSGYRSFAIGFSIGAKGYIGTGYCQPGTSDCPFGCTASFWEYFPATNAWTKKAPVKSAGGATGGARNDAISFSIGNKGYVGTGDDGCSFGSPLADFWEYDPASFANGLDVNGNPKGEWTQKASLPKLRDGATGAAMGCYGYVVGGVDDLGNYLPDLWEYNPVADSWTARTPFPGVQRGGGGGFVIGNKLYYGIGSDISTSTFLKDFWEWDQPTDTWTQLINFPGLAIGGVERSTFTIGCKGYYTGGFTAASGSTAEVWEFQPAALIPLSVNLCSVNMPCSGCAGTATANATGCSPPFDYSWSPSGGTNATATGLCPGIYTVTVTDAGGATVTATVGSNGSLSVTTSSTQTSCTICTGTAIATPSGGTSYTYLWSANAGSQTNDTATALCAGTYSVTVTDISGCSLTQTVPVTSNNPLTVGTSSTLSTCAASNGSATASPSGGTSYTYSWSPSGQITPTATGLDSGNYVVTVTDVSGCSLTQTVPVTSNNPLTVGTSSTQTSCASCNGTATASPSGGTSYTYLWSANTGSQTNDTATALCAGTYNVTVNDVSGCSITQTVTVAANNPLTLPPPVSTQTICTACNGTAIAAPSGGTGYTYSWNTVPVQTNDTATALCAGTYSVTVTDPANGCTRMQTVPVTQLPGPSATASATPPTVTAGGTSQLSATGTGGVTYIWSPSTGLSCVTCANPIATPTVTTTYSVTVTDGNGCMATNTAKITMDVICGELFVPTAFSPNSDGVNELECMFGNPDCITNLMFSIFDRWGEKVFETSNPKICWDGTYKGKRMNTAVFVYTLEATLASGEKITKKGNISLVR